MTESAIGGFSNSLVFTEHSSKHLPTLRVAAESKTSLSRLMAAGVKASSDAASDGASDRPSCLSGSSFSSESMVTVSAS